MLEYVTYKLGDVATLINGRAYLMPELQTSGKYRIVRVGNFSGKDEWYYSDMELSADKYCENGDLLYKWACNFGPEIWTQEKAIYHYHIWKIIPDANVIDKDYLYYLLQFMTSKWLCATNGSTMVHITKETMERNAITVPKDVNVQKQIASVLKRIDSKITLNNAICAELEAMAKLLYDYWFVQFDFQDETGKPYKSSGGKMVWSEDLKREIPEGWEYRPFADCIQSINTGLNPRDNFKLNTGGTIRYLTVKNLTTQGVIDFASCDYIDEDARSIVHRRSDIAVGDILFASIAPLGRCYLISEPPKDWDINESVFSIRPNYQLTTSQFLYMTFMSEAFIKKATNSSTGSVFKGIRINDLLSTMTLLPPIDLLLAFDKKVNELFAMKANCAAENTNLVSLRDFLLPLLMNGQVTFKEADCH